jgi:hypothetical protein
LVFFEAIVNGIVFIYSFSVLSCIFSKYIVKTTKRNEIVLTLKHSLSNWDYKGKINVSN